MKAVEQRVVEPSFEEQRVQAPLPVIEEDSAPTFEQVAAVFRESEQSL